MTESMVPVGVEVNGQDQVAETAFATQDQFRRLFSTGIEAADSKITLIPR